MTKYTDNLLTPYPETTDIGDVPKNMRDIATNWENAFGGSWQTWNLVVTQGTTANGEQAVITMDGTTIARSFKTGKTVYATAYCTILTGTGLVGYVTFSLPYAMASADEPAGIIISKYSASSFNRSLGNVPIVGPLLGNTGWIYEQASVPAARTTGDWFGLLLRYETV